MGAIGGFGLCCGFGPDARCAQFGQRLKVRNDLSRASCSSAVVARAAWGGLDGAGLWVCCDD